MELMSVWMDGWMDGLQEGLRVQTTFVINGSPEGVSHKFLQKSSLRDGTLGAVGFT
jgi:hypothetical protein